MTPRALIVDDESPAREELRYLLENASENLSVQVVGEATNGEEALVLLRSLDYDLVFLDIRMPGLSGLEVAEQLRDLPKQPRVIFTTAYPDHAVEAFDLAAADYLVKPFDAERLLRAVDRALGSGSSSQTPEAGNSDDAEAAAAAESVGRDRDRLVRIPVQRDGRTVLIEGDAIVYAAASRGYSSLKLAEDKVLVSFSLNELERRLHGHFCRVHRSYLVNLKYVRELVPDFRGHLALVMNDRQRSRVEVSRRHARELRQRLGV